MLRILPLLLTLSLAAFAACSDDNGGPAPSETAGLPTPNDVTIVPVTPVPKPDSVPGDAKGIPATTQLGKITRSGSEPPQTEDIRHLSDATCQDDVIRLETGQEVIYAAFAPIEGSAACDRFWNAEALAQFLDKDVAITLEITQPRSRVLIETLDGAQSEFTVGGIWVE